VPLALLAQLVQRAPRELLGKPGPLALRVRPVPLEQPGLPARRAQPVLQAPRVRRAQLVPPGLPARRVPLVPPELRARPVLLVPRVLVPPAQLALPVRRVQLAQLERRAPLVQQVLAPRAQPVLRVRRVLPELRVPPALRVLLDRLELRGLPAQPVRPVPRDRRAPLAQLAWA